MEEKDKLRNALFEKYFEVEEGIYAIDFVNHTLDIREKWKELHHMFEENVKYFDSYSSLDGIQCISCDNEDYLIINLNMKDYIVLDIKHGNSLLKEELKNGMTPEFFIHNFGKHHYMSPFSSILEYKGDVEELIQFYLENQAFLELPTRVYYELALGEAWTSFSIDIMDGSHQLCFQTPDQFLYEQLFLREDLQPFGMQDATQKIGEDKIREMFARIPTIRLPKEVIPEALYERVSASMENYKTPGPVYSKK